MRRAPVWLFLVAAFVTACGGKSPSSPSSPDTATINGSIVTGTQSSGGGAGGGGYSGMVVSISGSNVQATVDGSGRFTLRNVPPGDAQLNFKGPSFNGMLGLAGVHSVSDHAGSVRLAMTDAAVQLASLAHSVACGWDERPTSRGQRRE